MALFRRSSPAHHRHPQPDLRGTSAVQRMALFLFLQHGLVLVDRLAHAVLGHAPPVP